MKPQRLALTLSVGFLILAVRTSYARAQDQTPIKDAEVTLNGSMVCNGACIPDPKAEDHVLVVFAIDGTAEIRAEVGRIMKEFYPEKGLDGEAAQKLMDEFSARLKFYIAPDSPALKDAKNTGKNHYCMPALARAVTGVVTEKDRKKWITATRIEPAKLKYPDRMLAADNPFVMPEKEPLNLKVSDNLTLKCIAIPPGRPRSSASSTGASSHSLTSRSRCRSLIRRTTHCISSWCGMLSKYPLKSASTTSR